MTIQKIDADLGSIRKFLPEFGNVTHERTTPSSVTIDWGVAWSEDLVARDLFQNFRDANKANLDQITVRVMGSDVCVSAPTEFNLARLFFLGSEKTENNGDIGQYGEGFKAAAVALLRDFHVTPLVISGSRLTRLAVAADMVEGTNLRPIEYDFYTHAGATAGSHLILRKCSTKLISAMKKGLEHFFWPKHPKLGEQVFRSKRLDVFESVDDNGSGFYLGLKRIDLKGIPLVFVYKEAFKSLDTKIAQDRDRKAFDEKVAGAYYSAIAKALNYEGFLLVLEATRLLWTSGSGHPLLAKVAAEVSSRSYRQYADEWDFYEVFGEMNRYYAHVDPWDMYNNPHLLQVEQEFKREKRIKLPSYFTNFGIQNVHSVTRSRQAERIEQARAVSHARPTPAEQASIDFLAGVTNALNPELIGLFARRPLTYLIGESEELLGEMRKSRGYQSNEIMLNRRLFSGPLCDAFSTYVHELSHVFGFDGERHFTDALTELLAAVVKHHQLFVGFEEQWAMHATRVIAERDNRELTVRERVQTMTETDLRTLLGTIPDDMLKEVLHAGQAAEKGGTKKPAKTAMLRALPARSRSGT